MIWGVMKEQQMIPRSGAWAGGWLVMLFVHTGDVEGRESWKGKMIQLWTYYDNPIRIIH